jgi:hypothetical protein
MHDLEKEWARFEPTDGVNLLNGDDLLRQPEVSARYVVLHPSWDSLTGQTDFGVWDARLHLSLLPQPFFGCLSTASVFVLTLNPGLHPTDYFAEFCVHEYKEALINTLRQRLDDRFPFIWFNPRFSWHSGFSYWHGRFARLVDTFAGEFGIPRVKALSFFARSVATIELLPYHSVRFGLPRRILRELHSVDLAHSFVWDVLVPRSKAGQVLLIAARQGGEWGLPEHRNTVVYSGAETRAAYLTPNSRGGEAILKHLKAAWRNAA